MMMKGYNGGLLEVLATYACLMLLTVTVIGDTVISYRGFKRHRNHPVGVNRLGQGWVDLDMVSCASSCLRRHKNCITVMFNRSTRLCTPGSTLNVSAPLVSSEEGDLYIVNGCLVYEGFTLWTYNGTSSCLKLSADNKIYEDAVAACEALGGFLASFKTKEKQAIVKNMLQGLTTTEFIWVGCDDRVQEGFFEWKEDGKHFFVNSTAPETLGADEGLRSYEDCLGVYQKNGKYIMPDLNCDLLQQYICERYVL